MRAGIRFGLAIVIASVSAAVLDTGLAAVLVLAAIGAIGLTVASNLPDDPES